MRKEMLAVYRLALVKKLQALIGAQISDRAILGADDGRLGNADLPAMALHAAETEVSAVLVTERGNELRHVKAALERVGDGTFGFCEMCSMPIPQVRLKVVPHATRCVACQREAERRLCIFQREPDTLLNLQDPDFAEIDFTGLESCTRF